MPYATVACYVLVIPTCIKNPVASSQWPEVEENSVLIAFLLTPDSFFLVPSA